MSANRAGRVERLRLLVLALSDRCDQRCAHCAIWSGEASTAALSLAERLAVVDEALASGLTSALLTGGEPLLSPDLWPVAERLRAGGARVLLATNGMLLGHYASRIAAAVDEVYVSLDGASVTTHDGLRGVPALARVAEGVAALARVAPDLPVIARCTLHARNLHEFPAVIDKGRRMGFRHVSFLALDVSSEAFGGGDLAPRRTLLPTAHEVDALERAIAEVEASGGLADGFVLETATKLHALAGHLRASGGEGPHVRPPCDAPWWSSVVETDGSLRPCFFHPSVGNVRRGLVALRGSLAYGKALDAIAADNATCDRCVCPKQRPRTLWERLLA